MTTYVLRNGKLVEKAVADPLYVSDQSFYVISDEMAPTRHMANNKHYTSKRKFRDATKAAGCIEVGNDPAMYRERKPVPLSREQRRDDIRRTIYELRNGINR